MVSFNVSPLEELVVEASWKPMTRPPKRLTAVSKLNRVRVEGSKNKVAATFPFQQTPVRVFFKLGCVVQNTKNVFFRTLID